MAITIKNKDNVTFTFNNGDVESISRTSDASLDVMPMPMSPSNETFVNDFNGATRRITMSGHLNLADTSRTSTGTTLTTIDQDKWLDALITGLQEGYLFNDGLHDELTIFIMSYNSSIVVTDPNSIPFSLEYVEGANL